MYFKVAIYFYFDVIYFLKELSTFHSTKNDENDDFMIIYPKYILMKFRDVRSNY